MLSFVTIQIEIMVCTMQDTAYTSQLPLDMRHFFYFLFLFYLVICKNLPAVQETQVLSLGWEDSLEKEVATHSSILAWEIPWTEELVGYTPWGHKEADTTERLTPSLLPFPPEAAFLCLRCYEFSHTLGRCGYEVQ